MLTYRTGAAGAPSAARAMADHLLEQTLPRTQAELAAYYQRSLAADGATDEAGHDATLAESRRDMDPLLVALLGLASDRVPTVEAIAQLLAGNRADGAPIWRRGRCRRGADGLHPRRPAGRQRAVAGRAHQHDPGALPRAVRVFRPDARRPLPSARMCWPGGVPMVQRPCGRRCWRG